MCVDIERSERPRDNQLVEISVRLGREILAFRNSPEYILMHAPADDLCPFI